MMSESLLLLSIAGVTGLILSVVIEQLMMPKPPLVRHWAAWVLHIGVWLFAYGVFVLALGRPWFAVAGETAFLLVLVLVNNAKYIALREPFVFHDYEYFTDAILHPRLYIPFLGWGKFIFAALGFVLAITVLMLGEATPQDRFGITGQLGGVIAILILSGLSLFVGHRYTPKVSFKPMHDVLALGLVASLWRYAQAALNKPVIHSPFNSFKPNPLVNQRPHLVAVQSESFFDPRPLHTAIRQDVLTEFDQLKQASILHGKLQVPAWGANTVRTEFAFLSGIEGNDLGVHQFNPYRALAAGWDIASVASFLKNLGYRTVCVHPYPASFYQRNIVYPRLGFDEFIDISAFSDTDKFGPYTSDEAVGEMIVTLVNESEGPIFVFAITMENHGPLHLESAHVSDVESVYEATPPQGFDEMTIYLRHLKNADKMMGNLKQALSLNDRLTGLCWYGDHVPILPDVYQVCGYPEGDVDFFFWTNQSLKEQSENVHLSANALSAKWLQMMGLI